MTILLFNFKYFMPKNPLVMDRNAARTRRDKTTRKLPQKRMLPINAMQPASVKLLYSMTLHTNNYVKKPISVMFAKMMVTT